MQKIYALGLHKTGSTSLQMFLLRNQRALMETGILYPPVTPQGITRLMAEMAGRVPATRPSRLNEYMGHNALAYRMIAEAVPGYQFPKGHNPMFAGAMALGLVKDMAQQMAARALVFCSEDLARAALLAPAVPGRFAAAFGTEETTLMAVIRRPDEAIASWQTQLLRFRMPVPALTPKVLRGYFDSVHVAYRRALSPWCEAFPAARLAIADYATVRRQGGSVGFFRAYCGLDLPDTLSDAEDRNPGLHPALFEIARQATHGLEAAEFAALRDLLFALPPEGLPDAREVDFLDAGTRRALLAHFTPIHDWLAGLTGSTTFFDDLDDIARPRRLSHLEAARIALPLVRAAAERAGNDGLCSFLRGLETAA